jgi:UDP-N-acetylmuramate--alanine ligase
VAGKVEPIFAADTKELIDYVKTHAKSGDVVLVMGAGNIGAVPAQLVAKNKN